MDSAEDGEFLDDYDGLDYNVIPRPQDLIDEEKKISTAKILIEPAAIKPDFSESKKTERKQSSKSRERERKSSSRHQKKGSSKEKVPTYKSPLGEGSPVKKSVELSKRFEAVRKLIQRELNPFKSLKSESLKIQKNEHDPSITESKKSNQNKDKKIDIPVSKIMTEAAITPMQRFQVLEARDAALRASMSKSEDTKKIKIIGACPDMCPEKERYGRIAKNCVSVLEMTSTFDPNVSSYDADHFRMVKEYSRSSADQQEPLPHELRPVSVLKLTMEYLICNILDKCHDSISLEDWYDFIWNRTRSIRKDITQQQLCDPTCVEIIEKCVRFHIHCAEALSEEETAIFDPRINNENLTKCLQTLKHMYEDLQSKGIESPNEAEFRSYDILLSLTEGETLRLIKDIRRDLLKSPSIKSAFEAALAFNSDNYVKFFQILEKADYLSSCILHRYIIKVRSNALQIIVRAYSTQHNTSSYPISRLVNDLKFENESEAAEFCRCHALQANEEFVTIDRKQFSKSPSGVPISRSSLLVGQKKGTSLGLIINKGILPSNPKFIYQPYNSFDENNMLKIDCLGVSSEKIGERLTEDKKLEQDDEMMDIEENAVVQPAADLHESEFEKNSKIEIPNQDSQIAELEKRRAELLVELHEVESYTSEKQKQKTHHLSKQIEKKKSSKKVHLPHKSHKSIMFSSETSDFPVQKPYCIKSVKEVTNIPDKTIKPAAISSLFSELPPHTDSSFFNFAKSTPSKAFALACASKSAEQFTLPKVFTTASSLPVTTPVTNNAFAQSSLSSSSFPSFSFQVPKSFGFSFKPTIPVSSSSTAFTSKFDENNQQWKSDIFSNEKISNAVSKTASEKSTVQQLLIPEIIIDHSETCDEGVTDKKVPEVEDERSICLSNEKSHQLLEENTTSNERKAKLTEEVITSEFVKEDPKISDEEIKDSDEDIEERKKDELISKFVNEIADEVLLEVVKDCCLSVCEEVLDEERKLKVELDNKIAAVREQLAKNAIYRWRIFVQKRREKRIYENLAFYSPWQAILLNTPRISSGAISPFVAYKKHCSLTKTAAEILKKRFEVPPGWEKVNAEQIWTLNSFRSHSPYAEASYFGSSGIRNFFKLCIVFPHDKDSSMTPFREWICAKFALEKTDPPKFDCRNVFRLHMGETAVVVRAIELTPDVVVECEDSFLNGVTGMMIFLPNHAKDRQTFFKKLTTLRDSSILDSRYPLYMYFMGLHNIPTDIPSYFEMKIDLSFTAVNMQCIPDINNFVENSQKILDGLLWFNELKDRARSLPVLKKIGFRHYVEDAFSYVFSILLCKVSRDEYKFLLEDPQFIIDFYNRVMKFRASVLCNDFLNGIRSCWPPEEIKDCLGEMFIDMEIQHLCKKALENLLLPDFEGNPYEDSSAWEYARLVPSSSSNMVLSIKISDSSVDWVRKIIYCAEHLIQNSDFILTEGNLPVYYIYEDLLDFGCDPYWLNVLAEMLPHQNSSKRKICVPFETFPLKKSKLSFSQSTSKVQEADIQNTFAKRFEDTNVLNHKLSSMAVGCERKSLEQSHEKLVNTWTRSTLTELDKENDFLEKASSSSNKLPSKAVGSERKSSGLLLNNLSNIKEDMFGGNDNWIDFGVKKPSENTWSTLTDRLSELRYNIQKNSILENHCYELLNKQL